MDPRRFQRTLTRYLVWLWIPCGLLFLLFLLNSALRRDVFSNAAGDFLGWPLVATNGSIGFAGFAGIGWVSIGGLAVGALAIGGGAFGLIAIGGGALGLIACGGGAIGLLAFGGGAVGYVAIGGGACGVYVLAGDGAGKYVFSRNRQDAPAVRLFSRYFPRLRDCVESPGPVA